MSNLFFKKSMQYLNIFVTAWLYVGPSQDSFGGFTTHFFIILDGPPFWDKLADDRSW